jgi:hypothetical protein
MKIFLTTLAAVLLASALVMAQDTSAANSSSTDRSSWTGLLVTAACPRDSGTPMSATKDMRTTATPARRTDRGASVDQAVPALTDRVTTPPVDDKGTRGSATASNPPTGTKDQENSADRSKSESATNSAGSNTGGMDKNCYIGQSTNAFALKLKDGRMMRFDDVSNAKIAHQLQSGDRLVNKIKIFRATVKGSTQGDTITVDSIQM